MAIPVRKSPKLSLSGSVCVSAESAGGGGFGQVEMLLSVFDETNP